MSKKKGPKDVIRGAIAKVNAAAPGLNVTCSVEHRLTRPKNFPGVYVPWMADKGFIWVKAGEVEVRGPTLDALVTAIRSTTQQLMEEYSGDDLEAVRVQASLEVDGVMVTFDIRLETNDAE